MASHVPKADLVLKLGAPEFLEVLDVVLDDLVVESVILAEEIKDQNAEQFNQLKVRFSENAMTFVSHEEFKQLTKNVKLFIRTGETTPYSNIILKSGNIF